MTDRSFQLDDLYTDRDGIIWRLVDFDRVGVCLRQEAPPGVAPDDEREESFPNLHATYTRLDALAARSFMFYQNLSRTYPNLVAQLTAEYVLDPDPDGITYWVRGYNGSEPYGSRADAEEAKAARIMLALITYHLGQSPTKRKGTP
jgi:hypothetical protein